MEAQKSKQQGPTTIRQKIDEEEHNLAQVVKFSDVLEHYEQVAQSIQKGNIPDYNKLMQALNDVVTKSKTAGIMDKKTAALTMAFAGMCSSKKELAHYFTKTLLNIKRGKLEKELQIMNKINELGKKAGGSVKIEKRFINQVVEALKLLDKEKKLPPVNMAKKKSPDKIT